MNFRVALLCSLVSVCTILAQIPNADKVCALPLHFGKNCTTAKPSVRYYMDKRTKMCMAFKYKGCGGNKNNFKTISECWTCLPLGYTTCPGNTAMGAYCESDKDCKAVEYCQFGNWGSGSCCRKAAQKKIDADYNGKCAKGRKVLMIDDFNWLIGKNCKSDFCPKGSNCKNGNFFATCCGKA